MYANREVFPNAPLALVVAEVRFTDSPRLRRQETLDAVAIALEERFPFARQLAGVQFNLPNLGHGDSPPLEAPQFEPQQRQMVLTNTSSTESITVGPSSITYETTAYSEFDDLSSGVTAACEALTGANVHPALLRVGLRYIDEIRAPQPVTDMRAWGTWIDSSLIAPLAIGPDDVPVRTQGFITFDLGDGKGLNFQYAALTQGAVVEPMFLKRRPFEPGPFFILDFDGFQDFSGEIPVPLDPAVVADVLYAVHAPAGAAFQRAITDNARALFRGGTA
ncbi:MAG: TIGR04255 family protein [Mycobacterium sp.]